MTRVKRPRAALFCMPEAGHFQRLRSLIGGLDANGFEPHVFTDERFAPEVERSAGRFADLFAGRPLAAADDESVPFPCRYVSFAGRFADDVIAQVKAISPAIVLYDTFAAIGPVVGRALGVPCVNLCAGHNMDPANVDGLVANHPRIAVSGDCDRAVEALRERHGIEDASPFSYLTGLSPDLNLYCEPPEFLTAAQRRVFEPVAFYGSLPAASELEPGEVGGSPWPAAGAGGLKVYACFGTVVWRYWAAEAFETLRAVSAAVARTTNAQGLISLGGAPLDSDARSSLEADNVTVADYVDQWRVLRGADVLITHQGLNSTHEAIYNRVPMLSYPFLSDQPGLAGTCARLGLATRLSESVREPLSADAVERGLTALAAERQAIMRRLDEARDWERAVLAERPAVIERILALSRQ